MHSVNTKATASWKREVKKFKLVGVHRKASTGMLAGIKFHAIRRTNITQEQYLVTLLHLINLFIFFCFHHVFSSSLLLLCVCVKISARLDLLSLLSCNSLTPLSSDHNSLLSSSLYCSPSSPSFLFPMSF